MTPNAHLTTSLQSPLFVDRDHLAARHPGQDLAILIAALLDPACATPPDPNPIFDVKT